MSELTVKNGIANGRDGAGRFTKGNRGGPGRPRTENSLTEMLRTEVEQRPNVVARLVELCESEDERVALEAIKVLLNRIEPLPKDGGNSATAVAAVVNIIRGGSGLGMEPK